MNLRHDNPGFVRLHLAFAIVALLAPAAHVLELPDKFALNGALWLAVQQHLYRGWGPFLGGPAEIGALVISLAAPFLGARKRSCLAAALAYATMIAVFFAFNRPVNQAVNGWTLATLPRDWPSYRVRWESGHAFAAALAVVGLLATVRSWRPQDKSPGPHREDSSCRT